MPGSHHRPILYIPTQQQSDSTRGTRANPTFSNSMMAYHCDVIALLRFISAIAWLDRFLRDGHGEVVRLLQLSRLTLVGWSPGMLLGRKAN